MPNVNFKNFQQIGNLVTDIVKQATGRKAVQNLDMDYVTVAQKEFMRIVNGTGGMVTFNCPAQTLHDIKVNIPLVQSGSGDPSPENIRPLSTYNKISIHLTGKNIFGGELLRDGIAEAIPSASIDLEEKTITFSASSGTPAISAFTFASGLTEKFKENTRYTIYLTASKTASSPAMGVRIYYTDGTYDSLRLTSPYTEKQIKYYVTPIDKTVSRLTKESSNGNTTLWYNECGIFEGVISPDDFEPYHGEVIEINTDEFASGYLDNNTGKITVDSAIDIPDFEGGWSLTEETTNWTAEYPDKKDGTETAWCSHFLTTTYEDDKNVTLLSTGQSTLADLASYQSAQTTAETPIQVAYLLEELQELSFTPIALTTFDGYNSIWSDAGDVDVTYQEVV